MTTRLLESNCWSKASRVGIALLGFSLGLTNAAVAQPQTEDQGLSPLASGISSSEAAFGFFGADIAISADTQSLMVGAPGIQDVYKFIKPSAAYVYDETVAINGQYTPVAVDEGFNIAGFGSPGSDAGVIDITDAGDVEFLVSGLDTPAKVVAMRPGRQV